MNDGTKELDRIKTELARLGAQLFKLNAVGATLMPIEGGGYVVVGTLAGIVALAGRGIGTPVGGTNKAVLTDEQIIQLAESWDLLSIQDGGRVDRSALIGFFREGAAPASADSPSTAGAAIVDEFSPVFMLLKRTIGALSLHDEPEARAIGLEARDLLAAPAVHPERQTDEVRDAALEEAALEAERMQDEYNEYQGHRWPEMRDDAATGAAACASAIRALKAAATDNGGAV